MGELRITTRNARFQQWHALLTNRRKRTRTGQFLVQGVRPITIAVRNGWPIDAVLYADQPADQPLSGWATQLVAQATAPRVAIAPDLLAELGGKEQAPEIVLVGRLPDDVDDLGRITVPDDLLVVALDRPAGPGNIGTVIRSADAFGAAGVIVTGHAADPYHPQTVRASTGSLFALPVARVPSHREVLAWAATVRTQGIRLQIIGADEHGVTELADCDLRQPVVLVVGNETAGLSVAWRQACDHLVRIPMPAVDATAPSSGGAASSLNAAAAATVALYEAVRQRRRAGIGQSAGSSSARIR